MNSKRALKLFALVLLVCPISLQALQPFTVYTDKKARRDEVRRIDQENRRLINFKALTAFIQEEAKKRGVVTVGSINDQYSVDLSKELPLRQWNLKDPLEPVYTSGNWSWTFKEKIQVCFNDYSVVISWEVELIDKTEFKLIKEEVEDWRYIIDG